MAPPPACRNLTLFSASPAPLRPLFAVVVKEAVLVEHKLKIPTKSGMIFGEELLELCALNVPNSNRVWQVRIEKNDKSIYICLEDGVNDFINHYSIHSKSILQFTYQGNSSFYVRICDALGAEIDYPIDHGDDDHNDHHDDKHVNTPIGLIDNGSSQIKPRKRGRRSRLLLTKDHSNGRGFYWHQTRNVSRIKKEKDDDDDDDDDDDVHLNAATAIGAEIDYPLDDVDDHNKHTPIVVNDSGSSQIKPRKRGRRSRVILTKDHSNGRGFYWHQTRNVSRIKKEKDDDDDVHLNTAIASPKPRKRGRRIAASKDNKTSHGSHVKIEEKEEEHEMIIPRSFSYINGRRPVMSEASKKAVRAAQESKPRNPSFLLLLKSTRCNMDVPAEFVRKYMRFSSDKIELQPGNEKNNKWPVRCYYADKDRSLVKRLGSGWGSFSSSQKLKKGDICVFEMIRCVNGVVFRVWIYRSANFAVKDTFNKAK
ncbi:B3 domain-containing transcription factor VRN1-like [Humulus lupulus]|uniref:B3 domain-containing transcription factor VRN1-like n=1 Tax=Humulus lupulus TaxID=3486 RepID=UPI002B406C59|nr:B3 domain-containing transcription factor VRN1-like [Humulus lupulus]